VIHTRKTITAGPIWRRWRAPGGAKLAIDLAPAAFEWRAGPATYAVSNAGTSRVEIIEFELK
jgi:hypothetical protein